MTENPSIQTYSAESKEISLRKTGLVDSNTFCFKDAISSNRISLDLLSIVYFHLVDCTEAFSFVYFVDLESQGNFTIPFFWRSCDIISYARDNLRRLQRIGDELDVFDNLLQDILNADSRIWSLSSCTSSQASPLNISPKHFDKATSSDMKLIWNNVSTCCEFIKDVINSNETKWITCTKPEGISLHRRGVSIACLKSKRHYKG